MNWSLASRVTSKLLALRLRISFRQRAMCFIWLALLVRRPLSMAMLYRLDLVYSLGIGACFGTAGAGADDCRGDCHKAGLSLAGSA